MEATAKPLLQLCRRRACLLRTALEALRANAPEYRLLVDAIKLAMNDVDNLLMAVNKQLSGEKEGADGRDSD